MSIPIMPAPWSNLLQRDLFGDWTLIRCWGGLDNHLGQYRIQPVASEEDGITEIQAIERRRASRGYRVVLGVV